MTPSDPGDSARTERLNDLKTRFEATLAGRVEKILTAARAVRVGTWPEADGESLLAEVHGLAGNIIALLLKCKQKKALHETLGLKEYPISELLYFLPCTYSLHYGE